MDATRVDSVCRNTGDVLMRTIGLLLGFIWNLPASFLGLLVAATKTRHWKWCHEMWTLEVVADAKGLAGWYIRTRGLSAMTIGNVIVYADGHAATSPKTRAHELRHVFQGAVLGPFFPFIYGLFSLVLWLRGGDPDRENPFEVDARDSATHDS